MLGTKNFAEEYILGQLYGQALQAKGFKVEYKGSFGSSELANTAIKSGKMNFYPEYTGVDRRSTSRGRRTSPKSAAATYGAAKTYEQKHGLTLLKPTPFFDSDTFTVLTSTANKDGLKTITDLKKVQVVLVRRLPGVQDADHVPARPEADLRAQAGASSSRSGRSASTRCSTRAR